MYFFAYDEFLNRKVMATHCPGAKPHTSAALPNYRLIFSGWQRRWHGGGELRGQQRRDEARHLWCIIRREHGPSAGGEDRRQQEQVEQGRRRRERLPK